MKRITLEIQYADKRSEMKQLEDGAYIIGRDTGDIVLKSTLVSGRHGELKVSGSQVIYTDQGSTNGTFTLDGSRLTGPLQMSAGTGLRIGECKIILKAIHVVTSKTVMHAAVKPAFSSTKTVMGQPAAIFPPPSSRPPAPASRPPVSKTPSPAPMVSSAVASRPPVSKTPSPVPLTPVAAASAPSVSQSSAPPARASVPPIATIATEPAPPPYDTGREEVEPEADDFRDAAAEPSAGNALVHNEEPGFESFGDGVSGFSYDMEIGALVNAPMQDKNWITKCIIMGLIGWIPIAGQLNLWGWLIAIYNTRRQGVEELPPANLSYMGEGVKILLAWLPAMGAYFAIAVLGMILPFLYLLIPVLMVAVLAAAPAVLYLCIEKDVAFASMKIKDIMAFAKSNSNAYIQLILATLVAALISGAGGIVFIGTLITVPFGAVMQAAMLAGIKEE